MQAAPVVAFDADDRGAARAALALLSGLVAAVLLRWALGWGGAGAGFAAGLALAGGWAAAAVAWRRLPGTRCRLAWDGSRWLWRPLDADGPGGRPADPEAGELTVAIDLGPWMLLRFDALGGDAGARALAGGGVRRIAAAAVPGAARAALYAVRPLAGHTPRAPV